MLPEEVLRLRSVGLQLQPYLGTPTAETDIVHSIRHDRDIRRQLIELGWDGKQPVFGAGKYWIDGANPGFSRLMGWDKDGPGPGTELWQPTAHAHFGRLHHDDGTTFHVVWNGPTTARETPRAKWSDGVELDKLTLPERCILWCGYQWGLGVRELPGAKHSPEVLSYSRSCRRGGELMGVDAARNLLWSGGAPLPLGADEDPWCAAFASAPLEFCLLPEEPPPHGLRVAVHELWSDAVRVGTARPAEHTPEPGDLMILGRSGGDPRKGGPGHVRRVVESAATRVRCIGGNENNQVAFDWHERSTALGWISYAGRG
jgi:hypothetical protein